MKKRAKWKTVASMVCVACLCASMTGCGDTTGDKAKEAENQNKLEIVAEQGDYDTSSTSTTEASTTSGTAMTSSTRKTTAKTGTTTSGTGKGIKSDGTNVTAVHSRSTRSATGSAGSSSGGSSNSNVPYVAIPVSDNKPKSNAENVTYTNSDNGGNNYSPAQTQPASNNQTVDNAPAQTTKKTTKATQKTTKATTKTTTKATTKKPSQTTKKPTTTTTKKPTTAATTEQPSTTEAPVKTTEQTTTTVSGNTSTSTTESTTPTTETTTTTETMLVPDVPKNVSENIDLSKAVVNGVEIHLNDDISLADFVKTMKLNVALGGSVCDYSFLYFNGNMYEDESEAEDKTLISIEVVDKDGKLIPANDQRKADADKYLVKGFKTSDFFTKEDDYVVEFCEGIHVGMSKEEIIALLGDGKEIEDIGNNFTAYSNGTNTLVIRYAKNDTGYAADDIMLLKN